MFRKSTNFYWNFIYGFSQIAAPLTLIMHITSGFADNELIFTNNSIDGVGSSKVIVEVNKVDK